MMVARGWGVGEIRDGGQRGQISKIWGSSAQHGDYN